MQDDELIVSIPERDGPMHDYTFSMQPNDIALNRHPQDARLYARQGPPPVPPPDRHSN